MGLSSLLGFLTLLRGLSYPSLYWHFNNASSPGPGLSLYNTVGNAPPTITQAGTLLLDSNAPFGRVDSSIVLGGDSTFIFRFNTANAPDWSRVIDFGNGAGADNIVIAFDGCCGTIKLHIYTEEYNENDLDCDNVWNWGEWNIVIITIGQGAAATYGNGQQICSWTTTLAIPTMPRASQYIGKSNWDDPYWTGELDFVWYLPRTIRSTEASLLYVDGEILGNVWTFQSPTALDYRISLAGSPSLAGGTLNLHGDPSQYAIITPDYVISGPTTFAARARLDSYQSWARVVDFSSSSSNDAVIVSAQSTTTTVNFEAWEGDSQQEMLCNSFWTTLGQWVDVLVTVQGTTGVIYRNGGQWCTSSNMWEPNWVTRDRQYIGKSNDPTDGGWSGAFEYVMHWNRALSASEAAYVSNGRFTLNPWIYTHFMSPTWDYPFSGNATVANGVVSFVGGRTAQYVRVDSSVVQLGTPFTVSMYVRMDTWQSNCRLMDFSNGPATDNVAITMNAATSAVQYTLASAVKLKCSNFFTLGNWTQLTLTHDGTTAIFYKNGINLCSGKVSAVAAKLRSMQYIGQSTNTSNKWFDGAIDYFMLFNTALTPTQVAALPDAWDRYLTSCAAFIPTDPRVNNGTCVNFGRQGTTCNLACNSPYVGFNPVPGVCTTLINAEQPAWHGQALTCVSQCPVSVAPRNSTLSCSGTYGNFYENSFCSFSCSTGFTLTGASSIICTSSGTWTSAAPTCVAVPCPTATVQYGNATCNGAFGPYQYTANCTFSCPAGFLLSGSTSAKCLANGTWSKSFPTCVAKPCSSLTLSNGNVSCVNPYGGPWTYGSTCIYTCGNNFFMTVGGVSAQSATTTCSSALVWQNSPTNAPNPVCNLVTCPSPGNLSNGGVSCDKGLYGVPFGVTSECVYACNSGFQLSSTQPLVCLNTGSWSSAPPTCVDINECNIPGTCISGAKCGNLVGSYYCGPTFISNVTSLLTYSSTLARTTGEEVLFSLFPGVNVNPLYTSLYYLLNPLKPSATTLCTSVYLTNDSNGDVSCFIGPGLGANLKLTLPYRVQADGSTGTVDSLPFSYPPPTIQSGTLRLFGGQPSTHVVSVNYTKGDIISFDGTGFLSSATLLSVTYGPPFSLLQSSCTLILESCTITTITCKTQPFASGSNLVFTVNANGVTVVGDDTFSIDNVPNVIAVSVAGNSDCMVSGNSVVNCPTTGGVEISIIANYLSNVGLNGFIGGQACEFLPPLVNVSKPNGISEFTFNCILPPGTGFGLSVVLISDGKYSQPRSLLSYAAPQITNLDGCVNSPGLAVIQCSRAGGDMLEVYGNNFGDSGSSVSIGGVRCSSTSHDQQEPQNHVTCITPPGYGTGRQVQIFQAAGPLSEEDATLDYMQCPSGTYQNGAQTTCEQCSPGSYSNSIGQFSCTACDPGRYAPADGSGTCQLCPRGSSQSQTGMSECYECEPGFYAVADGAASCLACDSGTNSSTNGSISCSPCSPGTYSQKDGTTGPTECIPCDSGYFSGSTQQAVCQICPVGKYSYPEGASTCTDCDPGFYQDVQGQAGCQPCSAGSYAAVPGRSECVPCDSGTAANSSQATFCDVCERGTVSRRDLGSSIGPTECLGCDHGTFMPTSGQAVCLGCTPGTYADTTGLTACIECNLGYYQSNSSAPECAPCDIGTYSALSGRPECLLCGSGSFANSTAASQCTQCQPGTFSTPSDIGVTACTPCFPGTYVNTPGQVACLQCALGTFSSQPGAIECSPCPPGTSAPSGGSKDCTVCGPGRFSSVGSQGTCSLCPIGKYMTNYSATACVDCPAGTSQSSQMASSCDRCDPGKFTSVSGRDSCTACPIGQFANLNGSSGCTDCPPGTFQGNPSQTSCDLCPAGKYAPKASSFCIPCPLGLVSLQQGSSTCGPCSVSSTPATLQASCDCDPGYFLQQNVTKLQNITVITGTGPCVPCPAGTVCSKQGLTRQTIPTQNGYYLTDAESLTYQRCLSPKSCVDGQCVNNRMGLLCSRCKPGYSMSEWTKECTVCGSSRSSRVNMGLTIVGLLIAVSVLYGYIISTALQQAAVHPHYAAQSGSAKIPHAASTVDSMLPSQNSRRRSKSGSQPGSQPNLNDSGGSIQPTMNEKNAGGLYIINPNSSRPHVSSAPLPIQNTIENLNASFSDHKIDTIMKRANARNDRKQVTDNTYVLKILVNFFQVASSLISLPVSGAIAFPTYYMTFLSYFKFLSIDFIPWQNVGCLFHIGFYTKLVVLTSVPLMMILLFGVVVAVATLVLDLRDMSDSNEGRSRRQKIRFVFLRGVIFTIFMLYPIISSSVLSHFVCLKVGNQTLLVADFSVVCYSAEWMRWNPFAIIMTLIYPIGVPTLFFILLYRNKTQLSSPFAALGLGFLHESYIPQVWWFEVLVMIQKLALTSLLQFLPLSIQLGGGVVVAAAFLITLVLVQPEIRLRNWLLHMLANVEIVLLLLLWHFSYRENITQAPVAIDASISALFIVLTVALAALLFLDVLRWMKEKIFFLVRYARTSRN